MTAGPVSLGILFSRSGPYETLGQQGYWGAMAAVEEINAGSLYGLAIKPEMRDPAGSTEAYAPLCRDLVAAGCRFIVGCTTSWSRKEVIPILEKTGSQLWYPCPYEGFEGNEQVVYVGACPNQHVLPLLDYLLPRHGREPLLVGSNYIWAWEASRIAREVIERTGGRVKAERFVPLGDGDVGHIIDELERKRPDFVLSTLVGSSSQAFLRAYHELGRRDPDFLPSRRPIACCTWTESEVHALGDSAEGHFTVAPYFESIGGRDNAAFLATVRKLLPGLKGVSALFAQAYAAVHMIARGIAATGSRNPERVLAHATTDTYAAPFGPLRIHAETNHALLAARVARAARQGMFEVVSGDGVPILPDPYLTRSMPPAAAPAVSYLRAVK